MNLEVVIAGISLGLSVLWYITKITLEIRDEVRKGERVKHLVDDRIRALEMRVSKLEKKDV